jgi:hypothetical protein
MCFIALLKLLTKNDEKLWNNPESSFSKLICGLSPNFGEKLLFCNIYNFLVKPYCEKWPFSLKSLLLQVQTAMKL